MVIRLRKVNSVFLASSLIAAFGLASALGPSCTGQSKLQVGRYTSTLFSFTFDFQRDAAWQRKHNQALEYVHHTSRAQLAVDLRNDHRPKQELSNTWVRFCTPHLIAKCPCSMHQRPEF
jgi:hypothetical protein